MVKKQLCAGLIILAAVGFQGASAQVLVPNPQYPNPYIPKPYNPFSLLLVRPAPEGAVNPDPLPLPNIFPLPPDQRLSVQVSPISLAFSDVPLFFGGTYSGSAAIDPLSGVLRTSTSISSAIPPPLFPPCDPEIEEECPDTPSFGSTTAVFRTSMLLSGSGGAPVPVIATMDFDASVSGDAPSALYVSASGVAHDPWSPDSGLDQPAGYRDYVMSAIAFGFEGGQSASGQELIQQKTFFQKGYAGNFLAAEPIVTSANADNLLARLIVPLTVMPGQEIQLGFAISAGFPILTAGGPAVSGIIDATNTARIGFILPDGYSLLSTSGALAEVPGVAAVPAPPALLLLSTALGALLVRVRGRVRKIAPPGGD